MVFLQSSSAFFKIPPSNQKKADENCRKIKVTQIIVFLQSSSAFFKIPPSNKRRLIKTAFFKITLSNKKKANENCLFQNHH